MAANIPPTGIPESLKIQYEELGKTREWLETMKKNQALRGVENYKKRMADRAANHNTWRQMKGMKLLMHEASHPGNKPFVIGFGIMTVTLLYVYGQGLKSDGAKQESKYWQRFHAKDH